MLPDCSFEDGIKLTISWYKENLWWGVLKIYKK